MAEIPETRFTWSGTEVDTAGDGFFAALAGASEVLVTSTVQMLVLGSGITFSDRGEHTLKGIPGSWHLFAVETT